jgi:MFS family permease
MRGLVTKLGRKLVFIGLVIDLVGCGWLLGLVVHTGTHASLWTLAPALFITGVGVGLSFATIPTLALGGVKPEEAGSASGTFSTMQQLASAIGVAAVSSVFFQAAISGFAHAIEAALIAVLAITVLSLPVVALMPRKALADPAQ